MEPLRTTKLSDSKTSQMNLSARSPSLVTTQAAKPLVQKDTVINRPSSPAVMKTSKSIGQKNMYSLDSPSSVGSSNQSGSMKSNGTSSSPFDLDEVSSLVTYIVLFLLLLWAASFFFKRGQLSESSDVGNAIKVLSQKVVSLSPRQRIMVVETMGHTFVVGACDKGGLSHIAHLSTPNGPVGGTTFPQSQISDYVASPARLDALGRFDDQREYYSDRGYPIEDQSFQRVDSAAAAEVSVTYEENTFVGEDEAFTSEVLPVNHSQQSMDQMSSSDAYHQSNTPLSMDQVDQYAADDLSGSANAEVSAQGFDLGEDEEDVNMKPGDLLQWIQKLNGTKG